MITVIVVVLFFHCFCIGTTTAFTSSTTSSSLHSLAAFPKVRNRNKSVSTSAAAPAFTVTSKLTLNQQQQQHKHKQETILKMVERSAFGKAAIGLNKEPQSQQQQQHHQDIQISSSSSRNKKSTTTLVTTNHNNDNNDNDNKDDNETSKTTTTLLLHKRDRALLALQKHLRLSTESSLHLLNAHPSLYTSIPSLSLKLLYLLEELNIPACKLKQMLLNHPTLTTRVILDSEENLGSTLQVLQEELDLEYDDLKAIMKQRQPPKTSSSSSKKQLFLPTLLNYSRSALKRKIRIYTSGYLSFPTTTFVTPLIVSETRMLQLNPIRASQVISILRDTLNVNRNDIRTMLKRDKMLLCYHPTRNTLPTIDYLLHGSSSSCGDGDGGGNSDDNGSDCSIGDCLGLLKRKGKSTLLLPTNNNNNNSIQQQQQQKQQIIQTRIKDLLIRYPNILSCSTTTHLQPIVNFLRNDEHYVKCTNYQLGRILYRRGNILLLSLDTLKQKVDYLTTVLDLQEEEDDEEEEFYFCNNDHDKSLPYTAKTIPKQKTNNDVFKKKEKNHHPNMIKLNYYESQRDEYGTKLSHILATCPDLLTLSLEGNLQPKFDYLLDTFFFSTSSLLSEEEEYHHQKKDKSQQQQQQQRYHVKQQLTKIFSSRPQLLVLSLEKNWKPKIEYLTSTSTTSTSTTTTKSGAGLTTSQVWNWWVEYPHMMSFTLDKMKQRVNVVKQIMLKQRNVINDGNDDSSSMGRMMMEHGTDFWWQSVNNKEEKEKDDDEGNESRLLLEANFLGWKEKKWKEWVDSNQ